MAIDGCSIQGLREGVRRLIRGEVEDHNGKFIPPTAILARVVRYEDSRIKIEAAHAGRKLIERTPENIIELTPEIKARRIEQLKQLTAKLQSM